MLTSEGGPLWALRIWFQMKSGRVAYYRLLKAYWKLNIDVTPQTPDTELLS